MNYQPGQVIRFTYYGVGTELADRFKEVLVLHSNWQGKVHAIDLKRLTAAEREVLSAVLDPNADPATPHRLPLVNDIRRRMNAVEEIKSPQVFYARFVKIFLRDKDAYRTYYPHQMLAVSVIKEIKIQQGHLNRKPLFRKI